MSGATRWLTVTAQSTSSSGSSARSSSSHSANWLYIHTHFGIGYRFDPEMVGSAAGRSTAAEIPFDRPTAEDGDTDRLATKIAAAEPR